MKQWKRFLWPLDDLRRAEAQAPHADRHAVRLAWARSFGRRCALTWLAASALVTAVSMLGFSVKQQAVGYAFLALGAVATAMWWRVYLFLRFRLDPE